MGMKSTSDRYGAVAIALHWTTAGLILGMIIAGVLSANSQDDATKIAILRVHAPVGIAILVLTLARLVWWLAADRKPVDANAASFVRSVASKSVHRLLYVMLIGMPISGFLLLNMSGAREVLFNGAPGPLPVFPEYDAFLVHAVGSFFLVGLLLLHVGAALYHQIVLKDRLLSRMGLGR